jgi:hypothetical protein
MSSPPVDPVARFEGAEHDVRDPDPWLALYLDQSVPIHPRVKALLLADQQSASRQFLLPLLRPLARAAIVFIQLVKVFLPRRLAASRLLHRLLAFGLRTFVSPEANTLILRHFHVGSQILDFIARNARGVEVTTTPLRPTRLADVKDEIFLQHDLNLFNFVIRLNGSLREKGLTLEPCESLDYSGLSEEITLEPLPRRWTNFMDLQSAIEVFTPMYQLFLTDRDFWRASNSLQLDETVALYVSALLRAPGLVALVNNRHPLVPLSTLRAGFRLMLHGLSAESLHALLLQAKAGKLPTVVTGIRETQ